jgi:Flp pilus assembly protein TadD
VAFLVHAGVDWDWELPAVVVVGLLCGVALLVPLRNEAARPRVSGARVRTVAAALTLFCVVPVTAALIGNRALAAAEHAAATGDWTAAERQARTASAWQPWSARPRLLLGLGRLAEGDVSSARASFERAVLLDPSDARAWFELGSISGPRARSEALRRLLSLDPVGTTG